VKRTCEEDHQDGEADACLGDHPARSEEDDDTEYVDHDRCEDSIPSPEQYRLRDEELGLPPGLISLHDPRNDLIKSFSEMKIMEIYTCSSVNNSLSRVSWPP